MSDGGKIIPDIVVEKMSAYALFSNEWYEWVYGPPLMGRGLAYWQQREREMIAARHPVRRVKRSVWRFQQFVGDWPRRLRNARAALAGEWERSEDD